MMQARFLLGKLSLASFLRWMVLSALLLLCLAGQAQAAFAFIDQSGVVPGSTVVSNVVTVGGLSGPGSISITQCSTDICEYAINGGTWTAAAGFVNNGDTVQARQHASSNALTETKLFLAIDGFSDAFSVTTGTVVGAGTLQFFATNYTVSETGVQVTISVTRTGGTSGAASVHYATVNGSATPGQDYTAKSGTLSWAAGDGAAKTFTVSITNDAIPEGNETFSVSLDTAVAASLGAPGSAVVTILDKSSTVQFIPSTLSVGEETGMATLTVSRSGGAEGVASVSYATANGTAVAGADYLAVNGTLNWGDGDNADKTISVPLINDSLTEPAETFAVTLGNPAGVLLGTAKVATVTLADGDSAMQFSVAGVSVAESVASGNVVLSVTRTGTSSGPASISYATADGTATAGSDYTAASGTLNWGAGDAAAKTITVAILNDAMVEGGETFKVNLTSAVGATLGVNKAVTVTITDTDNAAGALQFSSPNYTIRENGASIALSVSRSGGTAGAVTVQYATSNGSAGAGPDYTAKTGTLSWAAGDGAAKPISIAIINDTATEGTENFTVTLANPTGGAVIGATNSATVSIIDDETAATGGVEFQDAKYTLTEGVPSVTLIVTRGADTSNAAQVSYASANGTAMAGTDYLAQAGNLSWPATDNTTRVIVVPIVNDAVAEATEAFSVTLSNPSGTVLGANGKVTVTILDDDEVFPPGGQMPGGWTKPGAGDRGWYVSWGQAQAGVASLRSGNVLDGQKAQVEVTRNFQNGMVSFNLKASSEVNADYLRFYIDGVKKGEWSGVQTTWTAVSYPLVAGTHTLTWSYEKDSSLMAGADGAWIDTVSLPAVQ